MNKEGELARLDKDQIARLMNIVSLEGTILGLGKFPVDSRDYNLAKFAYKRELSELSGNLEPLQLFAEMVKLSR